MDDSLKELPVELIFSQEGHVYLEENAHVTELVPSWVVEHVKPFFEQSSFLGVLHLGILHCLQVLPSGFCVWQHFSRKLLTEVCKKVQGEDGAFPIDLPFDEEFYQEWIDSAFGVKGFEYMSLERLKTLWEGVLKAFKQELTHTSLSAQGYLQKYNPTWGEVGRVCFHLAENKKDPSRPFAFLATYTSKLSKQQTAQHLPLHKALQEFHGEKHRPLLLSLLTCVQQVAKKSPWVQMLVEKGEIYHPKFLSSKEAYQFLQAIPHMEESGVLVRIPNWWNPKKPSRPQVVVQIEQAKDSKLGVDALLDFSLHMALDNGKIITQEEWEALLQSKEPLVKIKDTWVEVDPEKLADALAHFKRLQKKSEGGLSILEGMRLLAGMSASSEKEHFSLETAKWSTVVAGPWLQTVLDQLRRPEEYPDKSTQKILQEHLQAVLRPYQLVGVNWLRFLYQLGLGGCLADDMGLGKTIQVLSLLILAKQLQRDLKKPHLLIVPASLLGNWMKEAARFAPSLRFLLLHGSNVEKKDRLDVKEIDLVVTTYGSAYRIPWLKEIQWDLVILDEAQLIKNPAAKQTRAIKELQSQVRLALTGTPIENRLGDLWSLFDFTSPGLLGSSHVFSSYVKQAGKDSSSPAYKQFMSSLHRLTQPYILRRLKSDKKVISDLPDKTEVSSDCLLSKEQIRLYQESVRELQAYLETEEDGMKRRGVVLSYLLRFKQICNHPAQWLGYGEYKKEESGKLIRLAEIAEEIFAKREKVLVFTQFTEMIPPLCDFLTNIFGRPGLCLDGKTPVHKRTELVDQFQQEQGPPFFVLSLRAGGTGLTLTRASHVIHFDRWWNPAVENQATDRAYRIGQKHPVLVHKLICRGTVEEKIDELISSKKALSQEVLQQQGEISLTELSNEQLMRLISLDLEKTLGD